MESFDEEDIKRLKALVSDFPELKEMAEDRRAMSRLTSRVKITLGILFTSLTTILLIGDKIVAWIKGVH
jgi:hypothetical protein